MARYVVHPKILQTVVDGELCYYKGINKLPEEVLCTILSYLPAEEIIANRRVCRGWKNVADSKSLWLEKFKRNFRELQSFINLLDIRKICVCNTFHSNLLPELQLTPDERGWLVAQGAWAHSPNIRMMMLSTCDRSWRGSRHILTCLQWWICRFESGSIGIIVDLWDMGLSKEFMDSIKPWISFSAWLSFKSNDGELTVNIDFIRNVDVFWIVQNGSLPPFHPIIPTVGMRMMSITKSRTNGARILEMHSFKVYPNDTRYISITIEGKYGSFESNDPRELYDCVDPCLCVDLPNAGLACIGS